MSNLLVIVICLGVGLLLQRHKNDPDTFAHSLNTFVIYVAMPALVLSAIPKLSLDSRALLTVVFAWLMIFISGILIWLIAYYARWSRSVTGALMLIVPLGNTGFLGIPLIEALLGSDAVPYAVLYDQCGTFVALNILGCPIAAIYSGKATSWSDIAKTLVKFPPFIALFIAFATISLKFPGWYFSALERISTTLVPLVMVSVGLQWRLRLDRTVMAPLLYGLLVSLLLTPLIAWLLLSLLNQHSLAAKVVVLEAAMPAMISAGVLAANYQLAPRLVSSFVGYSLLVSLVTVWIWKQLI
jgi:malate permease and related proteins